MESKIQALKEETLKLASEASLGYSDSGGLGVGSAIALMNPLLLTDWQVEEIIKAVKMSAHVLHASDQLLQEMFSKSMELGMLRSVQEALYMAEGALQATDEFGLPHSSTTKKPTVH